MIDEAAIERVLGEGRTLISRNDFTGLRAILDGASVRAAREVMNEETLDALNSEYFECRALAADEAGDTRATAQWMGASLNLAENHTQRLLYAVALIRLGDRAPAVAAYVRQAAEDPARYGSPMSEVVRPDGFPLLLGEIQVAREMISVSPRLAQVHARRALDLDRRQAGSALVLLNYKQPGGLGEALQIAKDALPYARGRSRRSLDLDVERLEFRLRQQKGSGG